MVGAPVRTRGFVLPHTPSLCSGPKETSTLGFTDDILDDPLVSSAPASQGEEEDVSTSASQGESSRPQSPETSTPE